MKVLQSNNDVVAAAAPPLCNEAFDAKNPSNSSSQHKLNEIQDLLNAHNDSTQNDR